MDDEARQTDDAAVRNGEASGKCVDWDAALDVTGGDAELLLDVLDALQIETPQMIRLIHESLATGDVKTLHRAAHTAKNAFYNIGAQVAGNVAYQIEMLGEKRALEQVPPLLKQLDAHMKLVEREVQLYKRKNGRD